MLVVENISKRFAGVHALKNVSLEFHRGKVNAIIGENGAGKSTLMKILSGVFQDYEGRIIFDGKPVSFSSPKEAQEKGIAIIHQELNLVPWLSIMENIFLGRELADSLGILKRKEMRKKTRDLLTRLRLDVHPDTPVYQLKVGEQQVVEIAKALLTDAEVIIMDEPTSAISEKEVAVLFEIIASLRSDNKAIVYISHKLDELFRMADRFLVLRDGQSIESGNISDVTPDDLINKMVGREIRDLKKLRKEPMPDEVLRVQNLSLPGVEGSVRFKLSDISFTLKKGEILGIFGLMGAGRTELMEAIFGLYSGSATGDVYVQSKKIRVKSPAAAQKAGLALVPEDRKRDGIIPGLAISKNISLTTLADLSNAGLVSAKTERKIADGYIDSLSIKAYSCQQHVGNLSGGNQQKVVLAKWLETKPVILMLDEPTRGIDINAKGEIYELIIRLAAGGTSIIVVSSEMPEILAISHRILVMTEGRMTAEFPVQEATEDKILNAAIPKN